MTSRIAAAALTLTALGVSGCPFITDPKPPEPVESDFLARTSPANLLHNLQAAYETRNTAEYESLLASDFTFYVSDATAMDPEIPDSWNKSMETDIQANMFDSEMVQKLELAFEQAPAVWDPANGMCVGSISNVNLYLLGATPDHPELVKEYRVAGGTGKFYFRREPWLAEGTRDSVWTIVQWWDEPRP